MCSLCSVTRLVPRHQPVAAGDDHTPTTAATSAVSTWTQSSSSIPLPPVVETEAHQLLPPAGGVSTWTKSSSGGPPAPGQTSEGEEGLGGVAGLEPLASSEDQGLTAPRYTLRWAAISQGVGVGMARGLLDPLASSQDQGLTGLQNTLRGAETGQKLQRSMRLVARLDPPACMFGTSRHLCRRSSILCIEDHPGLLPMDKTVCASISATAVLSSPLLTADHSPLLQRRPPRVTTHWKEQVPGSGDGRCDPHNQRRARAAEHKPRLAAQVRGGRQLRHAAARPSLVCNNACHVAGLSTSN